MNKKILFLTLACLLLSIPPLYATKENSRYASAPEHTAKKFCPETAHAHLSSDTSSADQNNILQSTGDAAQAERAQRFERLVLQRWREPLPYDDLRVILNKQQLDRELTELMSTYGKELVSADTFNTLQPRCLEEDDDLLLRLLYEHASYPNNYQQLLLEPSTVLMSTYSPAIVAALAQRNVNLNARLDEYGETLLHHAIYSIDKARSVNDTNLLGTLHATLLTLIEHGADRTLRSHAGLTPVMEATLAKIPEQHFETLIFHHPAGARITNTCLVPFFAPDRHGNTPLHIAAATINNQHAKILLQAGIDRSAKNHDGLTARDMALNTSRNEYHNPQQRYWASILAHKLLHYWGRPLSTPQKHAMLTQASKTIRFNVR